ncbi:hypothetical protein [Streptomyces millisiae]|uniref:Up-regulated in Daf-2 domain-containing protein n=1 Tax=Streptomyces millisiae TaxID=3075542 RepID=A0ABU2LHJ9_9ACTN|nr:hypothetical protein [Streptomyces sp. DSM 44918]MDT0316955.1 hypothetical protein [Streptomyces sp. DSM 44918]
MAGPHTGKAWIVNKWGEDLASVYLRHRRGNDPQREEHKSWTSVKSGQSTEGTAMQFTYETGFGSPFDYWWLKFVVATNNQVWVTSKTNFSCYVSSDDDGNVKITLDGAEKEMTVSFSDSSGCRQSLILDDPED